MSTLLVYDVGGTRLRAARWCPEAGLRAVVRRPAPSYRVRPDLDGSGLVETLIEEMRDQSEELGLTAPDAVAVGFAGPVDPRGRAWSAPTLWAGRVVGPVDLPALLRRAFPGAAVDVVNDVTAAGHRYLRAADDSLCIVTVSSGIGHKVFVRGRAAVGPRGRGGELGHLRVDWTADAPRCDCGGRGHLGAVASGRAVGPVAARRARADAVGWRRSALAAVCPDPAALTGEQLVAHEADPWARSLLVELATPLGRALAAVHVDTGVERFVLVGGFALAAGPVWLEGVRAAARSGAWDTGQDWSTMVELGLPDDDAGLVGLGLRHDRGRA